MKKFLPVLCLIGVILLSSVAQTQTKWIFVPPAAFMPESETMGYSRTINYMQFDSSYWSMYAPVYLPQNAIIESVHLIYYDSADGYIQCSLYKLDVWAGTYDELIRVLSSGSELSGPRFSSSGTILNGWRWVDTSTRAYVVRVFASFGSGTAWDYNIRGVRIQYH